MIITLRAWKDALSKIRMDPRFIFETKKAIQDSKAAESMSEEIYKKYAFNETLAHLSEQYSMLMSWPETAEHTNVILMTQALRSALSFLSHPEKNK